MWIRSLSIEQFRGIKKGDIGFSQRQSILVGPNGAGKSTVLEAFALLFGRDRLVRSLTEHDFYGSNPSASDRIRLVATITGFSSNDPGDHSQWFSESRGVPKWLDAKTGKLHPEPLNTADPLCVQIGYAARFDRSELYVDTLRYFHDDASIVDPFDEEAVQAVPTRLLAELGFFLVPAHRTWDRLISFNSDLFRKILESSGTLEAVEVIAERDRLREEKHRVDSGGVLKDLRDGIDAEMKRLMPGGPGLELRLTSTDTESLLQALVPHYRYTDSVPLPAGRHGSGLLSIQSALLVIQIAERRKKKHQNVIIALEEPELHMPPGVQSQILHRLQNVSDQLVCTTHSPRVASVCSAGDVRLVNPSNAGTTTFVPLLRNPLSGSTINGVRKLFQENRQAFIESLMHRFVLVPEGITDVHWIRLFAICAATQELGECAETPPFGTTFGVSPTHDACVVQTVERIKAVRGGVAALVDGDAPGDGYLISLMSSVTPPEHIFQWQSGWEIEDVVGWIVGSEEKVLEAIRSDCPTCPDEISAIVSWLKTPTNKQGAKTDILAHEAVASGILTSELAKARCRSLLNALVQATETNSSSELIVPDSKRSSNSTRVWRLVCEP